MIKNEEENCAAELVTDTAAQKSQLEHVVEDLTQQELDTSKELEALSMEFKNAEAKLMASRAGSQLAALK